MSGRSRVLAAMSGGVDSAVAALLLKRAGYDVIGVTMAIWPERSENEDSRSGGCCSVGAAEDARACARRIGIPHYTLDMRDAFSSHVIADFTEEYAAGRTPNPCIECNRTVKFDALLTKADALGCDKLATGHYARVKPLPDGTDGFGLFTGLDPFKDQSYVLYSIARDALERVVFPVGTLRKSEVREIAREAGLPVWNHPDSVEICFVAGSYRDFLRQARPEVVRPGPITDTEGRMLGTHPGVAFFTVGQRRNLGLTGGTREPLYVVRLEPDTNTVVVGRREEAEADELEADRVNWLGPVPQVGDRVAVRVRAHGPLTEATVLDADRNRVLCRLARPTFAPAPGQGLVLYEGERVVGGGRIVRAARTAIAAAEARVAEG